MAEGFASRSHSLWGFGQWRSEYMVDDLAGWMVST
jgi:hypothetical protein